MSTIIRSTSYLSRGELVRGRDILVEDGRITRIGKSIQADAEEIDGSGFLITPGLVNSHFHLGETVYRGLAPTTSLKEYLRYTDEMSQLFDFKDYDIISTVSLLESIKAGTSVVGCSRGWTTVKTIGLKGALGFPIMNTKKLEVFFKEFLSNPGIDLGREEYSKGQLQIRKDIWVHSILRSGDQMLSKVADAMEHIPNLRMSIHVSETDEQARKVFKKYGCTGIQFLDRFGLLNDRVNLVHCIHLTKEDIDLITERNANITICPVSNQNLGSGIPKLREFITSGINVAIGTDGLATNLSASLLDSARQTSKLFPKVPLKQLFEMITRNPAEILGFEDCGEIRVGASADLCFFKGIGSVNQLIEEAPKPVHMMISGRFVLRNREVLTIDEEAIKTSFSRLVRRLENE